MLTPLPCTACIACMYCLPVCLQDALHEFMPTLLRKVQRHADTCADCTACTANLYCLQDALHEFMATLRNMQVTGWCV